MCPKTRPAACPVAHTSAPAPAVAPRPRARSWSPGLVNGEASGGRCPPGGVGGQASCHIRSPPRLGRAPRVDYVIDEALKDDPWDEQAVTDADGREPTCRD